MTISVYPTVLNIYHPNAQALQYSLYGDIINKELAKPNPNRGTKSFLDQFHNPETYYLSI